MFKFIKNLFGSTPAETTADVPYKVVEPVVQAVVATPVQQAPKKTNAPAKKKPAGQKPAGQKPAVKAKTARNRKPKSKPQV